MSENKKCLFYIDHNPPAYSGTWGGAIHKGACKVNSTDCKDTDGCFIKNLYNKLKRKEQECKELKQELQEVKKELNECRFDRNLAQLETCQYKQAVDEIEMNISEYQALTLCKPRTMRENDCIYNILDIINKVKE